MTRVALYARYSSDNQRAASIEDQFRLCEERATREGWQVVDILHLRGIETGNVMHAPVDLGPVSQPPGGCGRVGFVQFHAQPVAAKMLRRHQGRTGPSERVERDSARRAEGMNEGQQRHDRLLRRVHPVAGIGHVDHVRDGLAGQFRVALGQQVSAFMDVLKKPGC
jgi:hypothetical protein